MASIIVASGPRQGDYYPLDARTVVIGRDAKCPIQILDERISRVHLQIRFDKARQKHMAEDLKSVNGVVVNGHRITDETALANGDIIEVGDTRLVFFLKDFPDRESAWDYYKIAGERTKGTLIQTPGDRPRGGPR